MYTVWIAVYSVCIYICMHIYPSVNIQDYTNERLHAVRIKTLSPGTVKFEVCVALPLCDYAYRGSTITHDVHVQHVILVQVLSDDVYHGSVEDELATECGRNKPNILKLQRYTYTCTCTLNKILCSP